MKYFVYVLANKNRTVFKVGITENILEMLRVERFVRGEVYTKKQGVGELVYSEECEDIKQALSRKAQLKLSAKELFAHSSNKM